MNTDPFLNFPLTTPFALVFGWNRPGLQNFFGVKIAKKLNKISLILLAYLIRKIRPSLGIFTLLRECKCT
jgi:hypothetical protein